MYSLSSFFTLNKAAILNEAFFKFIRNPSFDWRGFLDILIVAILVFLILTLIRKTRAMPMFIGVLFLGAVYLISIFLKLQLTQSIFNSLISALLVILAVVFQKEIRRFFEFIGLMGLKRKLFAPAESTIKIISQAVHFLAERRIGALLIFPGRENIYRHLEGGVLLNGRISLPLLLSLFDPSSPGHDGAVIIENDNIRRFAAHLPMADNIEAVKKFGTRHRAALGLAERTDAFIVIVSEEKGTISIAYNKQMITLSSEAELELKLRRFFEQTFPKEKISSYKKWISDNFLGIVSSLLISFALWLVFTFQISVVQKTLAIPIEFKNFGKEYIVDNYAPSELSVIFSGLDRDFNAVEEQSLKALIDLTNLQPGWHKVDIKNNFINYPSSLSLIRIDPASIKVHIAPLNNPSQ
jgi:uncharacterized protein (TIGR00159 family)